MVATAVPVSKLSTDKVAMGWVFTWIGGLWALTAIGALLTVTWQPHQGMFPAWITFGFLIWLVVNLALDQALWEISPSPRRIFLSRVVRYARYMRGKNIFIAAVVAFGQGMSAPLVLDKLNPIFGGGALGVITPSTTVAVLLFTASLCMMRNRIWLFWTVIAVVIALLVGSSVEFSSREIALGIVIASIFIGASMWLPRIIEIRTPLSPAEISEVAAVVYGTVMALIATIAAIIYLVYALSRKKEGSESTGEQISSRIGVNSVAAAGAAVWLIGFAGMAGSLSGGPDNGISYHRVTIETSSGEHVLMHTANSDQAAGEFRPLIAFSRGRAFVNPGFCRAFGLDLEWDDSSEVLAISRASQVVYLRNGFKSYVIRGVSGTSGLNSVSSAGKGGLLRGRIDGPPPMADRNNGLLIIPIRLALSMLEGFDAWRQVEWNDSGGDLKIIIDLPDQIRPQAIDENSDVEIPLFHVDKEILDAF